MRLDSKIALITGATSGMGRASARLFAKEGATVIVAARRPERGNALTKEITDAGGRALYVELDVTDPDQWAAAVDQIEQTYGRLHILMNIVGTNEMSMIPTIDVEQWNQVFETNVTSILVGIRPAHL